MFEKFTTQIATNVKQIGTKLDLHIKAASVAQAATDKKLEEHDKRLTDATTKIEGFQKEMEEIRKTLKTGAAARGASAPPTGARNAGNYDLSAFDSSRAQIDAVKTKLEIVFNAHTFDRANVEPTIKQLMQQAGYFGSGVFSVQDVKPFRQCKGTRVLLDLHPIDERNLLRNCLRKKDGKQWRSVIENVEAYTIDTEFIIRRDEPCLACEGCSRPSSGSRTTRASSTSVRASSSASPTARFSPSSPS